MPAVLIDNKNDHLRGVFMRCRSGIALWRIVAEVGLSATTMKKFVDGHAISPIALRKIQEWCDEKESVRV